MSAVAYRKAREDDFPRIAALLRTSFDDLLKKHGFIETSPFASQRLPPIPERGFPWFEMGLKEDSDGFWVAEVAGELAGITLAWVRGSLWYLAHLFVSPKHQGLDIGTGLLARALQHHKIEPITNRALVTFAYNPVSISLYARHGMYARDPLYMMECPNDQVKMEKPGDKVKDERLKEFHAKGRILSRIDERCVGYPRERNHEYLVGLPNVQCHVFSVGGDPIGYAYVWKNGRIGPLATVSHRVFKDIVKATLSIAVQQESPTVGMLVTGSNDALMRIALDQKMRILDNYLFMSAKPLANFSNYILYPTGAML